MTRHPGSPGGQPAWGGGMNRAIDYVTLDQTILSRRAISWIWSLPSVGVIAAAQPCIDNSTPANLQVGKGAKRSAPPL
jgi:hypothetical protein